MQLVLFVKASRVRVLYYFCSGNNTEYNNNFPTFLPKMHPFIPYFYSLPCVNRITRPKPLSLLHSAATIASLTITLSFTT